MLVDRAEPPVGEDAVALCILGDYQPGIHDAGPEAVVERRRAGDMERVDGARLLRAHRNFKTVAAAEAAAETAEALLRIQIALEAAHRRFISRL